MLKALIAVAAVVAAANVGIYVYSRTLPRRWGTTIAVVIDAPPDRVRPWLDTPARWRDWSPWNTAADPTLESAVSGPARGEGASMNWVGRTTGVGRLTIGKSTPDRIAFTVSMQGRPFIDGRAELTSSETVVLPGQTRVELAAGGRLDDTLARLFRGRLEAGVHSDFAAALDRLKMLVEADVPAAE